MKIIKISRKKTNNKNQIDLIFNSIKRKINDIIKNDLLKDKEKLTDLFSLNYSKQPIDIYISIKKYNTSIKTFNDLEHAVRLTGEKGRNNKNKRLVIIFHLQIPYDLNISDARQHIFKQIYGSLYHEIGHISQVKQTKDIKINANPTNQQQHINNYILADDQIDSQARQIYVLSKGYKKDNKQKRQIWNHQANRRFNKFIYGLKDYPQCRIDYIAQYGDNYCIELNKLYESYREKYIKLVIDRIQFLIKSSFRADLNYQLSDKQKSIKISNNWFTRNFKY